MTDALHQCPTRHLFRRKRQQQQQKHNLLYFRQRVAVGLNQIKLWEMKKNDGCFITHFNSFVARTLLGKTTRRHSRGPRYKRLYCGLGAALGFTVWFRGGKHSSRDKSGSGQRRVGGEDGDKIQLLLKISSNVGAQMLTDDIQRWHESFQRLELETGGVYASKLMKSSCVLKRLVGVWQFFEDEISRGLRVISRLAHLENVFKRKKKRSFTLPRCGVGSKSVRDRVSRRSVAKVKECFRVF